VVLGAPTMVFEEKDIDVCEGEAPTIVANVGALTLEHVSIHSTGSYQLTMVHIGLI
jgi:hypothetical protein